MSAEAVLLVRSWQVGARTCTMTIPRPKHRRPVHVAMEWDPAPPDRMTADEWRQYRQGRDAAIAEVAEALQVSVAVLDV